MKEIVTNRMNEGGELQIASLRIASPTVLAPMAGVTDLPFRVLCKEQGVGLLVTEMISAKGLLFNNKKTFDMLRIDANERPTAVQLFGSDPIEMARAARIVQECGADLVDVNMGCPVAKIVNNGEGSALLKNPLLVYEILARMRETLRIPLTVKIRSGWDGGSINAVEVATLAERAGVDAIGIHARTRQQMYAGVADWQVIKTVVDAVSIPVLGNGDVRSGADALKMLHTTGCAGVMVGRAAAGNPWIFKNINQTLRGTPEENIPVQEIFHTIKRHFLSLVEHKGEHIAVREMRQHAASYIKGLPFAAQWRARFNNTMDKKEFVDNLAEYCREIDRKDADIVG